jgi:alanyl-tRNA synthetase
VLGAALDGSGVALVAAVTSDTPLLAGALIEDAKTTIGGGGKPSDDLAVAGGKNVESLDDALDQARVAAGIG